MHSIHPRLCYTDITEAASDACDTVRTLRNLPEVREHMYTDHEISPAEHAAWLARLPGDNRNKVFVIGFDGETAGIVQFNAMNRRHGTTEWGFYLGSDLKGSGIGSVIEFDALQYAFETEGFLKVNCEVLATNQAVIKLHLKFGFVQEGLFRRNVEKNGERVDVYRFGLFREEWLEARERVKKVLSRITGGPSA